MGPLASLRSLSLPFHVAPLLLVAVFATLLLAGSVLLLKVMHR